jgi:hypothetical protein
MCSVVQVSDLHWRAGKSSVRPSRFPELLQPFPRYLPRLPLQSLIKASRTDVCMSLDSRADIIPYARFLDVRQQRQAIAAATSTPMLLPADLNPESPNAKVVGADVAAESPIDCPPATCAICP